MSEEKTPLIIEQTSILDFLVKDDSITWQSMLMDAVKQGNLDPWNIDLQKLSDQYVKMLKEYQEMNFTISGKVVLAAAILLRLKSNQFLDDDIANLDRIIANTQQDDFAEYDDTDYAEYEEGQAQAQATVSIDGQDVKLYPRTPQPRKRKVSMYDLVDALDKALEVRNRRKLLQAKPAPAVEAPKNVVDISTLIDDMTNRVMEHFKKQNIELYFTHLLPDDSKDAKVYTFMPLLYMSNARKVDLEQDEHFGDIKITLNSVNEENAAEQQD